MELEKIITMNGQNTTIGDVILRMACSPWFRYSFICYPNKDYLGHPFSEFAVYDNHIVNYYIEPFGEKKFTITGTQHDRTKEFYNIYVNGELLDPTSPLTEHCANAMTVMDGAMTKHLRALDNLTFKHAGHYIMEDFGSFVAVYYRKKLKFFISQDRVGNWRLDRPKITPVHPYHINLSKQCVENLLARQAR